MGLIKSLILIFLVSLVASLGISAEIQSTDIKFLPGSLIKIDGDSTMRKFSAQSKVFELKGQARAVADVASGLPWVPNSVEMVLEVKNLQSGEGILDEHMHENLKAEKFPRIELKLSSFNLSKDSVVASGQLMVAGVTKPIELKASLSKEGENLKIKGSKMVLMSDFGIDPPTMMMGTIKTKNEIDISFEVNCLINDKKQKG